MRAVPELNLRMVILDTPISNWEDPLVKDLFFQAIALKLAGYGKNYQHGVLPIDTTDFVGTHLLFCSEEKGALKVLGGFRSITASRCQEYRLKFPAQTILESSNETELAKTLSQNLKSAQSKGREISYNSSWTNHPEVKSNRLLPGILRSLLITFLVKYHQDYKIDEWYTIGVNRFQTPRLFHWMGLNQVSEPFKSYYLFDETVTLFHAKAISNEALAEANKNQKVWNNRLVIGPIAEQVARAA